jgi:hypothetical protein
MRSMIALGLAVALAGQAAAADPPRTLRLVGEAPAAPDGAPRAFVIDVVVSDGDSDMQTTLEGWLASTVAPALSGEATGACIETHCTLTANLESKLTITGDFGAASGPTPAHFSLKDDGDKLVGEGAASLRPLGDQLAGFGALAEPGAVSARELNDLLTWSHGDSVLDLSAADEPPDSSQRDSLATWQGQQGRLATGLIFTADLDQLRAAEAAAKRAAGWTVLGDADHGWSAGYPATLLPKISHASGKDGAEQRFASADGKATLRLVVGPPMSDDAFDAFVEKATADRDSRSEVNEIRANGDLELRYIERGVVNVDAYHNRAGGMARIEFTYPQSASDTYAPYESILQEALTVTDDLKP